MDIQKKRTPDGNLLITLRGKLIDNLSFEKEIGPVSGTVTINCRDITVINSDGIKAWIRYFNDLHKRGVTLVFQECAIPLVEQYSAILNFFPGGQVESIYVPFACKKCRKEMEVLFGARQLTELNGVIPPQVCPRCGSEAVFDDIEEEYLVRFMKKRVG